MQEHWADKIRREKKERQVKLSQDIYHVVSFLSTTAVLVWLVDNGPWWGAATYSALFVWMHGVRIWR
jgi:hypothetical protein